MHRFRTFLFLRFLACAMLLSCVLCEATPISADTVHVQYKEGSVHGYLALRTLEGKLLASGDLIQRVEGEMVVSHLIYRFKDGSIDDEKAVFSQQGSFRLISDHHVQKGPMFPKPMDVMIHTATGDVTVRYWHDNQEKVETTHLDLPADLSNGIILDVIKNVPLESKETTFSYLAATPKPRLIKFTVIPDGDDRFRSAGLPRKAYRLLIRVDLGGVAGFIAPLIGKQPVDGKVWVGSGEVPAFIRSESPLYLGGPILRTELTNPVWR